MKIYELYARAGDLARVAMGKDNAHFKRDRRWRAIDDPLAWWCLTEAIVELARDSARPSPKGDSSHV
jgi:hypothetical protein